MVSDNLFNPSSNNPKGFTSTSYSAITSFIKIDDLNKTLFDCPIFWDNDLINSFDGLLSVGIFNENKSGFARSFGGTANKESCWIHNRLFDDSIEAKNHLNLDDKWGNTAEELTIVLIKKGARYIKGETKGGRGEQIYIHSDDVNSGIVIFY